MAITTKSRPLHSTLKLLGILHFLYFFLSEGTLSKHTTHLIHRDSPLSPFYDPSSTHFDRLHNAFQRSLNRINHFKSAINPNNGKTQVPMKPAGGEYLMKISLGTPPVEVIGIADTGSDLIWTQCLPCIECYKQTIPLFDPRHSLSYHTIPCESKFCNALELQEPKCDHNTTCGYRYSYADGSHTAGNLASETLTLGISNPISLPNIVIGCAHDTNGIFDKSESGIIGLGGGKLSLISQLGTGGKKFSYCLVPTTKNSTSKINFGNDSVVSGPGVVTTPLVTKAHSNSFFITLEAFSVGKERIAFAYKGDTKTAPNVVEGNVIIDTGTTITLLPSDVYNGVESALGKVIRAKRVRDPTGNFSLCYESIGDNIKLPIITAHFKGGDVKLQPMNTFSWVKEDMVCFTMISNDFALLGNLAQTNYLVGYDLEARTVSFKPIDCAQQV
ncbi:Aspartic proteinase CDR1 [Spatholobus suberectus]|nr:Aspartic proteinase CDR1 [Spatholobus suberectus]